MAVSVAMSLPLPVPQPHMVRLAQAGDDASREALAAYCRKVAFVFALQGCRDRQEAQDLAQDAVLRFFSALDRFQADRPVKPWLLTILRNLIRDRARRRKARRMDALSLSDAIVEPTDPTPNPESIAQRHQLQKTVWRALHELSPADREIVTLRDYLDLSYDEIAATLGIPRGTVMSRLHRARRRLGSILKGEGATRSEEVHDA